MIVERLHVRHFGPYHGVTLDLAPGLNVVYGVNEAGKSSLHAALYAAICGLRRGRGPRSVEDREFEERHRPWVGADWKVGALLLLADGRRVTLEYDLEQRTATAVDDLGRHVASEITNDGGAPDASVWLGLTRTSFLVTACVRQAELAIAADDAASIQNELQRAAATAHRDATAAGAIRALETFRSQHVGLARVNSTRPLQVATNRVRDAEAALGVARAEHARVLELLAEAESRASAADIARRTQRLWEAAEAEVHARVSETRLARIEGLAARHPSPPSPLEDDARESEAEAALAVWAEAPVAPILEGPDAATLEDALAALPPDPVGALIVPADLHAARARLDAAEEAEAEHRRARPVDPVADPAPGVDDDELRALITALERPVLDLDPATLERLTKARSAHDETPEPSRIAWWVAAALTVGGLGLLAVTPIAGIAVLVLAVGVAVGAVVQRDRRRAARAAAQEALRDVEAHHAVERAEVDRLAGERRRAEMRTGELGLAAEADRLAEIIAIRAEIARHDHELGLWLGRQEHLEEDVRHAAQALRGALDREGAPDGADLRVRLDAHVDACAERAEMAREAGRRPQMEAQLAARTAAESASRARTGARERLQAAALAVGLTAVDIDEIVEGLDAWLRERDALRVTRSREIEEWVSLTTLLGDQTLEDVREQAEALRVTAAQLAAEVPADEIEFLLVSSRLTDGLARTREIHTEAVGAAAEARGSAARAAQQAPSVPEAEESLARAVGELERVKRLDEILELTLTYMTQAQTRVHRDLAPVLASSVAGALSRITRGRYVDARVDPATLEVTLQENGGRLCKLNGVSHGTREQVYLLLRVALAEHLVVDGEQAPLLFDEVTAHCDSTRREMILEHLVELAGARQIVLFTHEEAVHDWAIARLPGTEHLLFTVEEAVPTVVGLPRVDATP